MRFRRIAMSFAVALLADCSSSNTPAMMDLAMSHDLEVAADLMVASPIGGPCSATAQCTEGKTPECFTKKLFNLNGYLPTPNGYCSSRCTNDGDCGAAGTCVSFGNQGQWCMAQCTLPTDCRSPGYACFRYNNGYCFPNGNLDCDPTANNGTCTTTQGQPGGCLRAAEGPGTTGFCTEGCVAGAGSCPVQNGLARQCVVYNQTGSVDLQGNPTGDKFHGAVCIDNYSSNAVGSECLYTDPAGNVHDYIDACADGAECYITAFTGGDNKCRQMCYPPGEGQIDAAANACPSGTFCSDVFGLFATANPIGLCK